MLGIIRVSLWKFCARGFYGFALLLKTPDSIQFQKRSREETMIYVTVFDCSLNGQFALLGLQKICGKPFLHLTWNILAKTMWHFANHLLLGGWGKEWGEGGCVVKSTVYVTRTFHPQVSKILTNWSNIQMYFRFCPLSNNIISSSWCRVTGYWSSVWLPVDTNLYGQLSQCNLCDVGRKMW